jgi:hypothetical protein
MTSAIRIAFDPWLAPLFLAALAAGLALVWAVYVWRGGRAPVSRLLAGGLLVAALANPTLLRETRTPLPDLAAIVIDASDSMGLEDRRAAARAAAERLRASLDAPEGLDLRVVEAQGDADGVALLDAADRALADAPAERIAGLILITDGRTTDGAAAAAGRPYPVHAVIVGAPDGFDRRLEILRAPRFAIVDQTAEIVVRAAGTGGGPARITLSRDGAEPQTVEVPLGEEVTLEVDIRRRGQTQVALSLSPEAGELTTVNNVAVASISGVRERLRVLLVTGEPHAGARAWRNLLKGDPSVDLVHFTILRPPELQDFTPLDELALIAFPVRELFFERLSDFDLVVFDRFRQLSILPDIYFENVVDYVRNGGALLAAFGPEEAAGAGLLATPIGRLLPVQTTGNTSQTPFRPAIAPSGAAHPVTEGLAGAQSWGRWFRLIEADATAGTVVMTGAGGRPLLVLDRAGEGRVAALLSDQVWLWARGFEGGGPFGELFRRTAHWLMQEPQLDEDRLIAESRDGRLVVERRTAGPEPGPLEATGPDGARTLALTEQGAGRYGAEIAGARPGLYQLRNDALSAAAVLGPRFPVEFADPTATDALLTPLARATGGGVVWAARGLPGLRRVPENARAYGLGWIGLKRRGGYAVEDVAEAPLLPAWLLAALALGFTLFAWAREGR